MYPHKTGNSSPVSSKSPAKREQIIRLLVTKFRNKFSINITSEMALDRQLCSLISETVSSQNVGEKQLVDLSRKLHQIV